ncbi:hypothetical protein BG011_001103 [Mortierella polycephala]|uniref:Mid2 domain-containing protein n=1 Tax=Mortierella polycephala TaxID=41804 RepID=A0A9P6U651_9FUNG|nr:hypothetical protein BG011_001103 [Mortierella polycephala]
MKIAKVLAYQCPDSASINHACLGVSTRPLIPPSILTRVIPSNAISHILTVMLLANAVVAQPHFMRVPTFDKSTTKNSMNVDGLLRRCGVTRLDNPYGSPSQYKPDEGTRMYIALASGTSTRDTSMQTAAPIIAPTESLIATQQERVSGGAIAGIVIGCLVALALAFLLFWFWRKKRHQNSTVYNSYMTTYSNYGPTRTAVTEKVEPVVVNIGTLKPTHKTTDSMPVDQHYNSAAFDCHAAHPSTSYNATSLNSYDTDTSFDAHTGMKK